MVLEVGVGVVQTQVVEVRHWALRQKPEEQIRSEGQSELVEQVSLH